jgi:hypothetical protein
VSSHSGFDLEWIFTLIRSAKEEECNNGVNWIEPLDYNPIAFWQNYRKVQDKYDIVKAHQHKCKYVAGN